MPRQKNTDAFVQKVRLPDAIGLSTGISHFEPEYGNGGCQVRLAPSITRNGLKANRVGGRVAAERVRLPLINALASLRHQVALFQSRTIAFGQYGPTQPAAGWQ